MKVILTGGKTGGHIFPLLKMKEVIKENHPNISFEYYGLKNSLEETICKKDKDIKFNPLELDKNGVNFKSLNTFYKEYKKVYEKIKNEKIKFIISSGGFVSLPVLLAARKLKIKYVLLEENVIMGRVVKLLYKKSFKTCLTFPIANLKGKNIVLTGNPSSQFKINPNEYRLDNKYINILVIGGSKGSKVLTDIAIKLRNMLDKKYRIILIAGKTYKDIYFEANERLLIYEFIDNLYNMMNNCDYIISRSGSSSICEALMVEKPLFLVPSRTVKDDHQYKNALYVKDNHACQIIDEKIYKIEDVIKEIVKIDKDIQVKSLMKISQNKLKISNSATKVYDEIKELLI